MDLKKIYMMKEIVIKINRLLNIILRNVLCTLFGALIVIVAINVICRYILKNSLFWVTELTCYILVYLIFLGSALALYQGEHVGVNTDGIKIPKTLKFFFERVSIFLNYVFIIFLIVFGTILSCQNMKSYTGVLPIPMGYVYFAVPVSGVVMLLLYTERILIKKKDE